MCTSSAITSIRPTHSGEFIAHKMLAAGSAMAASAINTYLVNKIAFFQWLFFAAKCKYTMS